MMIRETVASLYIYPAWGQTNIHAPAFLVRFLFICWEIWILENLLENCFDSLGVLVTSTGKHDQSKNISKFWTEKKNCQTLLSFKKQFHRQRNPWEGIGIHALQVLQHTSLMWTSAHLQKLNHINFFVKLVKVVYCCNFFGAI